MTLSRTNCPVCERDVAARRDGTPRTHNPPSGRADLRCSHGDTHCRGSHEQPEHEVLKVRVIGSPAAVERFAAVAREDPRSRVVHDSGIKSAFREGHVRLYLELEIRE